MGELAPFPVAAATVLDPVLAELGLVLAVHDVGVLLGELLHVYCLVIGVVGGLCGWNEC